MYIGHQKQQEIFRRAVKNDKLIIDLFENKKEKVITNKDIEKDKITNG